MKKPAEADQCLPHRDFVLFLCHSDSEFSLEKFSSRVHDPDNFTDFYMVQNSRLPIKFYEILYKERGMLFGGVRCKNM